MGKHYVVLSFFKSNNIDYYFDSQTMTILFPCPYCWEQITMNATTTDWKCHFCNQSGNLLTVMQVNKNDPIKAEVTIFNPKKELLKVNCLFEEAIDMQASSSLENKLIKLKKRVNELIVHYENKG